MKTRTNPITLNWRPIETAPKNPAGEGIGPAIIVWYEYDHTVYTVEWTFREMEFYEPVGGWRVKSSGADDDLWLTTESVTHWMPMMERPNDNEK